MQDLQVFIFNTIREPKLQFTCTLSELLKTSKCTARALSIKKHKCVPLPAEKDIKRPI